MSTKSKGLNELTHDHGLKSSLLMSLLQHSQIVIEAAPALAPAVALITLAPQQEAGPLGRSPKRGHRP